uniref:Uncharacterized protein n=1 Tax=Arundo donax TaxID=35708 RepID=A0A0A8ZTM2_ARUDO
MLRMSACCPRCVSMFKVAVQAMLHKILSFFLSFI